MLLVQQSQRFSFRSNHGDHPEFVSLSCRGDKQRRQCESRFPNLASLQSQWPCRRSALFEEERDFRVDAVLDDFTVLDCRFEFL